MGPYGIRVFFCPATLKMYFDPDITIHSLTTCQHLLGLPAGYTGTITQSLFPVYFIALQGIRIQTNLSVNCLPIGGELAYIPVHSCYGERIEYYDVPASDYSLVMNEQISNLSIRLVNQDGRSLDTMVEHSEYMESVPPWTIVLNIVTIHNPGFQFLPMHILPPVQSTVDSYVDMNSHKITKKGREEPSPVVPTKKKK